MITSPSHSGSFENLRLLEQKLNLSLPHINAARTRSAELRAKFAGQLEAATPQNCGLVICGSLARCEMTATSDVDWNLLIDGAVAPQHRDEVKRIQQLIARLAGEMGFNHPNPAGAFGGMCFSHELVHAIGGERDTNSNTTKRILLLLESQSISQPIVLDRVINSILTRYFEPDNFAYKQHNQRDYFPRFLMNDVVRFWRTMAVDYAAKVTEQHRGKWALRNAKLRFSRKLIFVTGILLAYEIVLNPPPPGERTGQASVFDLIDRTQKITKLTPMEILARALLREEAGWSGFADASRRIFHSYEAFMAMLDNPDQREELSKLDLDDAASNKTFESVRELSREFQLGLNSFMWDGPARVKELTHKYAIF